MSIERDRVGIIGEEDTITGFKICGLEQGKTKKNFIAVNDQTPEEELSKHFFELTKRDDISIIFINDFAADKIRSIMNQPRDLIPSILEIPSKNRGRTQ
ncbi:hypothetical protein BDAP_000105 [Binucleata daphniae]